MSAADWSMDLRKFGTITLGSTATAAQRDENTKTIGDAILAAYSDHTISLIDFPSGEIYLGQGVSSGTIRYNNAIC